MSFLRLERAHDYARILMRVLYLWFARLTLAFLPMHDTYARLPRPAIWIQPLWTWLGPEASLYFVETGSLAAILAVLWNPGPRAVRAAAAYFFLCQLDYDYRFGDIGHASHAYLWLLVVLALAPSWRLGTNSRPVQRRLAQNFFHAQAAVATFYFLSGFSKVLVAVRQLFAGEISTLHLTGMSRILATRLLVGNTDTLLGGFLIDRPLLSFLCFWSTVIVELSGPWILFRPRLHRPWGFTLIAFHLAVAISLSPNFGSNLFLVAVLFVLSPFALIQAGDWDGAFARWIRKGFQRKS